MARGVGVPTRPGADDARRARSGRVAARRAPGLLPCWLADAPLRARDARERRADVHTARQQRRSSRLSVGVGRRAGGSAAGGCGASDGVCAAWCVCVCVCVLTGSWVWVGSDGGVVVAFRGANGEGMLVRDDARPRSSPMGGHRHVCWLCLCLLTSAGRSGGSARRPYDLPPPASSRTDLSPPSHHLGRQVGRQRTPTI